MKKPYLQVLTYSGVCERARKNINAISEFWALAEAGRSCRLDIHLETATLECVASVRNTGDKGLDPPDPRLGVIRSQTVAYCLRGVVTNSLAFDKVPPPGKTYPT